jgi:uncharacterized protein YaaN involved in tellurite resistance
MEQNGIVKVNQEIQPIDTKNEVIFDSPDKIFSYGEEATKGVSRFADEILSQLSLSFAEESSKLLATLNHLMGRFDKVDFHEDTSMKGFFSKLVQKVKKSAGDLYDKYTAFSKEIDKIFVDIKKYELEIKDTNGMLDRMYDENMRFYKELEKYIEYGKSYLENTISPAIGSLESKMSDPMNGVSQIELGKYNEIKETLEQRIYDLELAKAVSLQTAPQIKLIQKGNYNLIRKINSAFVITMPLFKQGIIQAITVKRQKLHMDSMKALDESTNKLLVQNAHNIVENAKTTAQLGNTSSVRVESIEESYNTIINGIKDVQLLQAENRKQREESMRKLEEYKTALITGQPLRLQEDVRQHEA